jgi:hypothetical protein
MDVIMNKPDVRYTARRTYERDLGFSTVSHPSCSKILVCTLWVVEPVERHIFQVIVKVGVLRLQP